MDVEQPYSIKDPDTDEVLIVIDTSGRHKSLDDVEAMGLLTKTEFIVQKDGGRTETFDLSEIDDFSVDAAQLQEWTEIFTKQLGVIATVGDYIASWFCRFFQMILFAMVAVVLVKPVGTIKFAALLCFALLRIASHCSSRHDAHRSGLCFDRSFPHPDDGMVLVAFLLGTIDHLFLVWSELTARS